MQVSVKRTGGFAGLTEQLADVDTSKLDSSAALRIESLIREIRFFDLPATMDGGSVGADMYRYEVTVRDSGRSHTVSYSDSGTAVTEPLRRLVQGVTQS